MEERDTFPLGADPGRLVDEADAGGAAALEGVVEVVDRETDVMDAGPAAGDELSDRALGGLALEELDERVTGGEARDAGAVGVIERDLGKAEDVAVEWQDLVERAYGDPYVCDARGAARNVSHGEYAGEMRRRR
jgi:hypothetical protein